MPEITFASGDVVGESPAWFHDLSSIGWVDIPEGVIHLLNTQHFVHQEFRVNGYVSSLVPAEGDSCVVTSGKGFYKVRLDNGLISLMKEISPWDFRNRLNDAKCDFEGKLWAGTMNLQKNLPTGALFVFGPQGTLQKVLDGLTISNGITWNEEKNLMYHIDTPTRQVSVYLYNKTTPVLKPLKTLDLSDQIGRPDGMTIDNSGYLWIAMFGGGQVIRCDPVSGEVVDQIYLPTKWVTSCCFGGQDMRTLYITTASNPLVKKGDKYSGNLYEEKLSVSGLQTYKFKNDK